MYGIPFETQTAIVIWWAVGYVGWWKAVDGLWKLAWMAIEWVYNSLSNISSTKLSLIKL